MSTASQASFLVRPIQVADIPDFHRVLDGVCRERKYLAMLEAPPLEGTESFVRNNVQMDHPQFIALVNGQLAGWCDALPGESTHGTAHIGHLGMGVAKPFRRQGLGAKLMHAVLDKARDKGMVKIELEVYASNTGAVTLYQRFGFEEEGRKRRGRFLDDHYDDVVVMSLFLDT
ncbi:RimJ/RimL family protein N-acetyltransferase [Roseimicrobium gellanilyticum]|uniref:RimJ/RimL family protein N-acetyltransferase n=1 Tax=Roseimicrobium gellanilyticum TaxID=748857 RepID=A0A366HMV4_9BACT|nr:GNAT family N-acetyltransferase [Roseimicrobium gellanilyticum]RBP44502.1 RimJ/RimL family protein N-acetyltransferase [Roseimicrobium gellanilyticum]